MKKYTTIAKIAALSCLIGLASGCRTAPMLEKTTQETPQKQIRANIEQLEAVVPYTESFQKENSNANTVKYHYEDGNYAIDLIFRNKKLDVLSYQGILAEPEKRGIILDLGINGGGLESKLDAYFEINDNNFRNRIPENASPEDLKKVNQEYLKILNRLCGNLIH